MALVRTEDFPPKDPLGWLDLDSRVLLPVAQTQSLYSAPDEETGEFDQFSRRFDKRRWANKSTSTVLGNKETEGVGVYKKTQARTRRKTRRKKKIRGKIKTRVQDKSTIVQRAVVKSRPKLKTPRGNLVAEKRSKLSKLVTSMGADIQSLFLKSVRMDDSGNYEPQRPGSAPPIHLPAVDSGINDTDRDFDTALEEQNDNFHFPKPQVGDDSLDRQSLRFSAQSSEFVSPEIFPWQSQVFESEWGKAVAKSCELSFAGSKHLTSRNGELASAEGLGGLMRSNRERLKQMKEKSEKRWKQELPPLVSADDLFRRSLMHESQQKREMGKVEEARRRTDNSIESLQRRAFPMYYVDDARSTMRRQKD